MFPSPLQGEGWGFESLSAHRIAQVSGGGPMIFLGSVAASEDLRRVND